MIGTLISLAVLFGQLSLVAFGGGNSILPEMQRQVVNVHHWMTAQEFSALFGLAQAAPGPNIMIIPLIGWRVAGFPGLLVATVANFGPSSALTVGVLSLWGRFKDRPWRRKIQAGLAPMTVGLVAASAILITGSAVHTAGCAIILVIGALVAIKTPVHPLWVLAGGALGGLLGLPNI